MYRCNDCGREFDELEFWQESRGEFWGIPCTETMSGCPYCYSGDYDKYDEEDSEVTEI